MAFSSYASKLLVVIECIYSIFYFSKAQFTHTYIIRAISNSNNQKGEQDPCVLSMVIGPNERQMSSIIFPTRTFMTEALNRKMYSKK